MESKQRFVQGFDVDRYFDWHLTQYEFLDFGMSDFLKKALVEELERVAKSPDGFWAKVNLRDLKAANREQVETWVSAVNEGFETKKKVFEQTAKQGINTRSNLLKSDLVAALAPINISRLEWYQNGNPITESPDADAQILEFVNVKFVQWASQQLESMNEKKEVVKPSKSDLPKPLEWQGKLGALYVLFAGLQHVKFLDKKDTGSNRQIARWLKLMFGLSASEETISEQIGKMEAMLSKRTVSRLPKGSKELADFVNWLKELEGKETLT
jgi:hypothetical protein